jgi:hypothetical protein
MARTDLYSTVYQALNALGDAVDLYEPADNFAPDPTGATPDFPLAAWLLVALQDLAELAATDMVTGADRDAFVTGVRNAWRLLSADYDRRAGIAS